MHNKIIIRFAILFNFLLSLYCNTASAQVAHSAGTKPTEKSLQQRLNEIIATYGANINIGVVIQSLDNNKILYQHNANQLYTPASATKIFTAVTALDYLGANFQFSTQLLTDALSPKNNGELNGNLYIKFTGDPTLNSADLKNLIINLTQQGIHTINGNIIIDDTTLDQTNWGPGWMWDERQICYAAPVRAIAIDHNCFDINVTPNKQINAPPILQFIPSMSGANVSNYAITKLTPTWECPLDLKMDDKNNYRLTGCIPPQPANQPALKLEIALSDPLLATSNILLAILKENNVQFTGTINYARTPANAKLLAEHLSPPLSTLVSTMLKESDNLFAGILFKTIGAHYFHQTGTWENGSAAMQAILSRKTDIDFNHAAIVDGVGLSRYNQITPMQFIKLLDYGYHTLPANSLFFQALPIAGVDGTLKDRLKLNAGKIHAKTGTMASASSLVGYMNTNKNHTLAFAILINGYAGKADSYQFLEDKICDDLIENN